MGAKHCLFGLFVLLAAAPAALANSPDIPAPVGDTVPVDSSQKLLGDSQPVEREFVPANSPASSPANSPANSANSYYLDVESLAHDFPQPPLKTGEQEAKPPASAPDLLNSTQQNETQQNETSFPQDMGEEQLSPEDPMAQVTSVSQLSDVQPTDWAFQALQNLVERYGCVAGYPDGTFRGNRAMTRYEFAAGLNACLERINQLLQQPQLTGDFVTQQDLGTVRKLQDEFAAELATLRNRVETLEARTAVLEAQQFSTTFKFGGEVIFAVADATGGDNPPGRGASNTVFTQLARVGMSGTFTGKDVLRLGLSAGNFASRGYAGSDSFNTDMALLSYQADSNNQIQLDSLEYRFAALDDRVVFTVRPVGFSLSSVLSANSPYFDTGRGAVSRFAEASPIFKIGNLDAGVGLDWLVTSKVRLQVAYGTRDSNEPDASLERRGVFGASHSALGVQLLTKPAPRVLTGLTYINAYSSNGQLNTSTGSFNADSSGFFNEPAQIHAIGGSLQWRMTRNLTFGTWGGWIHTESHDSDAFADATTYLFSLGLSDPFGREGDLLAFIAGQPPKLVSGKGLLRGEDPDTSLHFEVFYRYRVSDNISITPGVFVVTNPEHDSDNSTIVVGTVRTVFRF
ncbi:MAG: iron uptake porin [Oscillatoria sp. Prado101]|jgi:hypothetical protein|nr:iron uptake porin [Oscillatoria sp. Prado101]